MQKAIQYEPQLPRAAAAGEPPAPLAAGDGQGGQAKGSKVNIQTMVMENPVVVFGRPDCCMCHVVARLLLGLGVNPTVYEVAEDDETSLMADLSTMKVGPDTGGRKNDSSTSDSSSNVLQLPAVFVGGKLFGGLDRLMASHISDELVPILRGAGALWL